MKTKKLESQLAHLSTQANVPYQWEMVAKNALDDDSSKWVFNLADGSASTAWAFANGQMTSPPNGGVAKDMIATFKGNKLNDGKVQVVLQNPNPGSGTSWWGIHFRAKSTTDILGVIVLENTKQILLWKYTNGSSTAISTINIDPALLDVSITLNIPLLLEVEIIGVTLKVYLNGRLMLTSTDSNLNNYLYGYCGVYNYFGRQYTYSDFAITRRKFEVIKPNISKVVCIGSSITYGVTGIEPYPSRLQTRLNNEFSNKAVEVVNAGVGGNLTSDMLNRLPSLISTHKPDVIVIETSINDTRKEFDPYDYNTTLTNLRKMIKLTKQAGAIPLLTTATPIDPNVNTTSYDITSWRKIYQLNAKVRKLASEEEIRLIENFNSFSNNTSGLLIYDLIHPNDAGFKIISDNAFNAITGI